MNAQTTSGRLRQVRHALRVAAGNLGGHRAARALTRTVPRILMYHRFARRPAWRTTDLDTFEQHLRYLQQHSKIVTMDALVDHYTATGRFEPDQVVVTVDDAYADFHALALPVLERLGVPVTLYVPTDFVDGKEWLWPDRLLWLVRNSEREAIEFGGAGRLSLATLPQRRETWNTLADALLEMNSEQRWQAFVELEQALGLTAPVAPTDDYRPMSWEQVRDAARRGVTIGSQATAHVPMARESPDRQRAMASSSKQRLETELGFAIRHFSYPHGRLRDFDQHGIGAARDAGFESSVSAVPVTAHRADLRYAMPRLSAPRETHDLRAQMSGLAHLREWAGA